MKKSKWQIQQELKHDKKQVKFTENGNVEKTKINNSKEVNYETKVYCPLCLYYGELISFRIDSETKFDGKLSYRMKCPECKNVILLETLKSMCRMTKKKIEAYAKWVYDNRRRFWSKIDKEKWNNRMKELKWNGVFWNTYNKVRAELKRPSVYNEEDEYASVREERLKSMERYARGER